ncbi:hypothetical protein IAR55_003416 [Kwoniella newhampshirensis]|uniref:Mediator of RNA polymerase II transcription subunit 1 n=1 Tax=Kwoniella newhampshirensis TaxID=1651941 RepID=A0AAW0YYL4_9TREE
MSEPGPSTFVIPSIPLPQHSSMTIPPDQRTVLQVLSSLLQAHQSRTHSHPYYNPYAPLSATPLNNDNGKGKRRSGDREALRELREGISVLRIVIGGERDTSRLSRALKEVTTHQSAILPSLSSLPIPTSSTSSTAPLFPSSHLLLPPTSLLQTLSKALGLEPFLEDSQFGLLKSSLAIAGGRFVVDVDLETDTLSGAEEGEGEDDDPMTTTITSQGGAGAGSGGGEEGVGERGKVRLSKLTANHVTKEGGTGKSDWISNVLRGVVELYLDQWNQGEGGDVWEKEKNVRFIESELRDLKALDDVATARGEQGGDAEVVDWFEELEKIAKVVATMVDDGTIYPSERDTIFPTFRLLLPASVPDATSSNPTMRIRPARRDEASPVAGTPAGKNSERETTIDVDMDESGRGWFKGDWVIEVVPFEGVDGIVVRRGWMSDGVVDKFSESDGKEALTVGIRAENLLYRPFSQTTSLLSVPVPPQVFPYTGSFVHSRSADMPEQHWSIAQPGPLAWVVGWVGLPNSQEAFQKIVGALRRQIVLNGLFTSIFKPDLLQMDGVDVPDDDDGDADDLLAGSQRVVPLTMTLRESSIAVSFPHLNSKGEFTEVNVVLEPDAAAPHYVVVRTVFGPQAGERSDVAATRDLTALIEGLSQ